MTGAELLREARSLLDQRQPDRVIDLLRAKDAPDDPARCALLARAYYQRGDSRGDMYACHFFASRALALGPASDILFALCGVAAFRKELFQEAADCFARYVRDTSPPASQFLLGLALLKLHRVAESLPWLERAAAAAPGEVDYAEALAQARAEREGHTPPADRMWMRAPQGLGGPRDRRPEGGPAPYRSNALSLLRGKAAKPRDFDWLEKNIPCQKACPAGTDIPGYLGAISRGDYAKAYRINLHDNVFPAVLGRVCSRPCEGACRHGWEGLGEPVAICFSKRSSADFQQQAPVTLGPWFPATGKRVAVIGAGVAGLACARNLALMGHRVTVYEKHSRPGGMMNQGIPEFRLPRDVIDREIEQVRRQGVEIVCGVEVGPGFPLTRLLDEFEAVVMACGTLRPNLLNLPGSDLQGIVHGLPFLLASEARAAKVGQHVVVIGGGFTAMDCARTAARLGAQTVELELETRRDGQPMLLRPRGESVKVLYRRSQAEMLITPGELEELNHEGIPMHFMVAPVAYVGENGRVKGMRFVRTELGEPDAGGRRRPVEVPGSEFEIPADTILLATGQFPGTGWIDASLRAELVQPDGWLKSGRHTQTAVEKLFVAGDFATGASTLIQAIAHGKDCARAVDRFLMGGERLAEVAVIEDATATGRIREMDSAPRQPMPALPLEQRTLSAEVERGLSPEGAADEAQRCYLCHFKYEIDPDKCIYCDWCLKAKPRPDCIVKVSSLIYDGQDRVAGFNRARSTETTRLIWINQADCIRCNACVDACPVDAISIQRVSKRTARLSDNALTLEL